MNDARRFEELTPAAQQVRLSRLAAKSLGAWGLRGELSLIKHRENAVYRLDASDGKRYALRLHRAGYHSDAALESELAWMRALAGAGISVPQVIPCLDGHNFVVESVDGVPEPRYRPLCRPDAQPGSELGHTGWVRAACLGRRRTGR